MVQLKEFGRSTLTGDLNSAYSNLISQMNAKKSRANIIYLQNRLNAIFYPKEQATDFSAKYQEMKKNNDEDIIFEKLNNFDFETNTGKASYYHGRTVKQYAQLAQELQNKVMEISQTKNSDKINTILDQLKIYSDQLLSVIKKAEQEEFKDNSIIKANQEFGNLKSIFDSLYALNHIVNTTVSSKQLGDLLEVALAKTDYVESASNDFLNKDLPNLFGDTLVSRGVGNGLIQYNINSVLANSEYVQSNKNFSIGDNNAQITYTYNAGDKKQGKMDVQLRYGTPMANDLRVSAKSWSRGYGSLGETTIDRAIIRAGGATVAERYRMGLIPGSDLYEYNNALNAVAAAHQFGRMAIATDIIMGLNQKEGYANLLIVDTGSSIVVKDLTSIVNEKTNSIVGYNEGEIESIAQDIYYNQISKLKEMRSSSYQGLMSSVLAGMKASINLSVK